MCLVDGVERIVRGIKIVIKFLTIIVLAIVLFLIFLIPTVGLAWFLLKCFGFMLNITVASGLWLCVCLICSPFLLKKKSRKEG